MLCILATVFGTNLLIKDEPFRLLSPMSGFFQRRSFVPRTWNYTYKIEIDQDKTTEFLLLRQSSKFQNQSDVKWSCTTSFTMISVLSFDKKTRNLIQSYEPPKGGSITFTNETIHKMTRGQRSPSLFRIEGDENQIDLQVFFSTEYNSQLMRRMGESWVEKDENGSTTYQITKLMKEDDEEVFVVGVKTKIDSPEATGFVSGQDIFDRRSGEFIRGHRKSINLKAKVSKVSPNLPKSIRFEVSRDDW